MDEGEPELIDPNVTIKIMKSLRNAFIIVNKEDQVYGTSDSKSIFVWTSLKKAIYFLENNLNSEKDRIIENPLKEILDVARSLDFEDIIFDFQIKGAHSKQIFVHYDLEGEGELDLLAGLLSN